jgi:hypothetical protein
MKPYPLVEEFLRPVLQVAAPRAGDEEPSPLPPRI